MSWIVADQITWSRWGCAGVAAGGLAAIALLGGCESLGPSWDPQPIEASQSVIGFEHQDFDPKRAEHVLQRDPRTGNQVYIAQFTGDQAFAVLVAAKSGPSYAFGERAIETYVDNLFEDVELIWGEAGRIGTRLGNVPYRMFEIAGQPLSCVGFGQRHGNFGDDRGQKNDLIYGYFCESDARPMTAASADDLISKVSVGRSR